MKEEQEGSGFCSDPFFTSCSIPKPALKFFFSAYLLVGGIVGKKPILKTVFTASLPYDSAVITHQPGVGNSFQCWFLP